MATAKTPPKASPEAVKCPNCGHSIQNHPNNGCVLHAFIGVLAERENLGRKKLDDLHAQADVDKLWEDLGPILDKLEAGGYSADAGV